MKIVLKSKSNGEADISDLCSNIQWSGDKNQIARKFEFAILSPIHDKNHQSVNIEMGDEISFAEDNKELFKGIIFSKEKSVSTQQVRIVAYDKLIYLINNYATYNFKKVPPEQIVKKLCNDFNIPTGNIKSTGKNIDLIARGESLIKIILKAYENVGESIDKTFHILAEEDKVVIIEKGKKALDFTIDANNNIIDANYGESIEGIVNRVIAYDEKNNVVSDPIENSASIKKYGKFQQVYESTKKEYCSTVAKNMLKGEQKSFQVTIKGNVQYKTGYLVKIDEPYTGMQGEFFIDSDNHTWNNSNYQTQLTLSLKE